MNRKNRRSPRANQKEYELDRFSLKQLVSKRNAFNAASNYHSQLHYTLAQFRHRDRNKIAAALQSVNPHSQNLEGWSRVVGFQYSDQPLSDAGSLIWVGGRFNIGKEVSSEFPPFGALYIAEDQETALAEKYGYETDTENGLTRDDLNLIDPKNAGYSVVKLRGQLENVFDLTNEGNTQALLRIISKYRIPKFVTLQARKARIDSWGVAKSHKALVDMCMIEHWRQYPTMYDIPANSQILGTVLRESGFSAVMYRSSKSNQLCLAVYLKNFADTDSVIEINDPPSSMTDYRIDGETVKRYL